MQNREIHVPEGWTETWKETNRLRRFEYEIDGTHSLIIQLEWANDTNSDFHLVLATVVENDIVQRHDFPVADYPSEEMGLDALEYLLRDVANQVGDELAVENFLDNTRKVASDFDSTRGD